MPIKFLLLGEGFWVFLVGGGWKCQILFLWARGFFRAKNQGKFGGKTFSHLANKASGISGRISERNLENISETLSQSSRLLFPGNADQQKGDDNTQQTRVYPYPFPKDPAVLKILRVVNLLRVVFLVRRGDLLSQHSLCGHHFPGNYRHFSSPRRVHGVVNLWGA